MKKILIFIILLLPFVVNAADVGITKVDYVKKGNTVRENNDPIVEGMNASIDNTFYYKEESIVYEVDIKNDSTTDYVVSKLPSSEYIQYELDLGKDDIIHKGEVKAATLTVSYKKEVPEDKYKDGVYSESNLYQLIPVKNDIINPDTRDAIIISVCGIAGLSIMAFIALKKNRFSILSSMCIVLMLYTLFAPLSVLAEENTTIQINSKIVIEKPITTMFLPGPEMNTLMKDLSGFDQEWGDEYKTQAITGFRRSDTLDVPVDDAVVVSTDDSEVPIYMWYAPTGKTVTYMEADWGYFNSYSANLNYEPQDNYLPKETEQIQENVIYYYSDANIVYTNEDSSYFFEDMFYLADMEGLVDFNTSKTTTMESMFYDTGMQREKFILDIADWNTSSLTNMVYMFCDTAFDVDIFEVDLSKWDVSNVTDMDDVFVWTGEGAKVVKIGDLSNWDVTSATSFSCLFEGIGMFADEFNIGDIGKWDVSNVDDFGYMFLFAGEYSKTWYVGDLSNWDMSNAKYLGQMFDGAAELAEEFNIGDIGKWDVSNVEQFFGMFRDTARYNNKRWYIGDLSNWDTSSARTMSYMFDNAGTGASEWVSFGSLDTHGDIIGMFKDCSKAKGTLNIKDAPNFLRQQHSNQDVPPFVNAATEDDALITVNYSNATTNIDDIMGTVQDNSHVVKGELID